MYIYRLRLLLSASWRRSIERDHQSLLPSSRQSFLLSLDTLLSATELDLMTKETSLQRKPNNSLARACFVYCRMFDEIMQWESIDVLGLCMSRESSSRGACSELLILKVEEHWKIDCLPYTGARWILDNFFLQQDWNEFWRYSNNSNDEFFFPAQVYIICTRENNVSCHCTRNFQTSITQRDSSISSSSNAWSE